MPDIALDVSAAWSPTSPHPQGLEVDLRRAPNQDYETPAVPAKALQFALAMADAVVFAAAGVFAACRSGRFPAVLLPIIIATALAVSMIIACDGYRIGRLRVARGQAWVCGKATLTWALAMGVSGLALHDDDRTALLDLGMFAPLAWASLLCARFVAAGVLGRWTAAGRLERKIAIVGLNEFSERFIRRLRLSQSADVRIVSAYRAPLDNRRTTHAGILVRGDAADLVQHSRAGVFDLVVVALPPQESETAVGVVRMLAGSVCDVSVLFDMQPTQPAGTRLEHLGGGFHLVVAPHALSGWQAIQKSVLDTVLGTLLLIIALPALAIVALAIRLDSEGPVLFRQERCGRNHQKFQILKFRTMYKTCEDQHAERQATRHDDRVTRVGRWLRRTSLDELPQLINVLRGEMSLVGPRPHALGTRAGQRRLEDIVDNYGMRHCVKPGITGLAQVKGCRGALYFDQQVIQRVAYDLQYIEQWSLGLDLKLLCQTIVTCLRSRNAY